MAKKSKFGLPKTIESKPQRWPKTTKPKSKAKGWPKPRAKAASQAENLETDLRRVRVDDIIVVEKRFRKLDQAKVDKLADSIDQLALMHPPTVYFGDQNDGSQAAKMYLNSGQHRIAAVKKLGWKEIDVIVVEHDKRKNAMRRITENLHRNNLSKHEEASEVLKWVEFRFAAGDGQVAHQNDKGISEAAKHFGKSRRTIRRLLEAAAIRPDAAMALKEAQLDNKGVVLEEVARENPGNQLAKVEAIIQQRKEEQQKREEAKKQREGERNKKEDDESSDYEDLKSAWKQSPGFRRAWKVARVSTRQRFAEEFLDVSAKAVAHE